MTATITFVDGEAYPLDVAHAWRGLIGGRYARAWRAWLEDGELRVVSFRHGGSGADPTVFVPELAAAVHEVADLGDGDVTAEDVAAAFVIAADLLGSTWVRDGAVVMNDDASDPEVEPTAWDDRGDVRIHGARRDYGTLDGSTDNGPIGGTVGGHTPSPGATYRVIALLGRADGGNATRLWMASGPAYATNPGAMSMLAQGVATIDNNALAVVPVEAAAVPDDDVWLGMRAVAGQLLRFRYAGQTPRGRGDYGDADEIFLDTAIGNPATALADPFDPGNGGGNYGLYPHVAAVLEAAPYWADGTITSLVIGLHADHDVSVEAPGPTSTLPADMAHETVSLRHEPPPWPAALIGVDVAIAAAGVGEDMGGAIYQWSDLDFPASSPPSLVQDLGALGITEAGWHHVVLDPIDTEGDEILSLTLVCGTLAGGPASTLSLVYDEDVGLTEVYPTGWLDGTGRNDHVGYMGGLGSVAEYTTRDDQVPPSPNEVSDPTITWPATLAITSTDMRPRNLPRIRYFYAHRDAVVVEYADSEEPMPEPADTAASITAEVVDTVSAVAAREALAAIASLSLLSPAIRGQLAADLTMRAAVEAQIAAAVTARLEADMPTIITTALADWTPPA